MEELVELGTGSDLGRGLFLARDSHGLYVAEAPKSLRLRQGDRVLGARLSFEGASPEAVGRLLAGAGGCRVSLHLRRPSPGTPGTPEGQRDGVGRLTVPTPAAPKKPPAAPVPPAAAPVSVELALPKLPKLPKPRGAPGAPPEPPRPRLTVREAAAARAPLPEPPEPPELPRAPGEPPAGSGPRIPAVEVAAPKGFLGLSAPQIRPGKGGPAATPGAGGDEEGAARGGFAALRVPSVPIDVPSAAVELAPELGAAGPEPPGASPDAGSRFAEGLRKLSRELEAPAVEIAPKPPKFRLPRLGRALAKLREGGATPPASPPGIAIPGVELDLGAVGDAGAKLKVPKVSLAPFGDTEDGPRFGTGGSGAAPGSPRLRAPRFGFGAAALPKFGGSSPDLRPGGVPKAPPKRGGSAESLILGWTAPEPAGSPRARPKPRGPPRIAIPAVGFALPGPAPQRPEARRAPEPPALKVPVLELVPPGLDGTSEPPGRRFGVKLPKFGAGSSGSGAGSSARMRRGGSKPGPEEGGNPRDGNPRRRRWVPRVGFTPGGASPEPPKVGRMRFPDVELCPGDPQIPGIGGISSRCDPGGLRGEGTPKFHLPQLVLSPQICGEP